MKRNDILMMDEPTAGLSPKAAAMIVEGIERAQRETGLTLIVVEHNLRLIAPWATRVIALMEGKVVMDETDVDSFVGDKARVGKLYFEGKG